ncbi:hypothetical protein WKH31_16630 [Metabacillus indicus]|uniref:hypothetical protein n=1 Tax=Metabacillus indicus TaxID=246786 RepID=UPI00316E0AFA
MKQTLIIQQTVALIEELSLKKWSEAHQPLNIFLCEYNCFFAGLIETHKTPVPGAKGNGYGLHFQIVRKNRSRISEDEFLKTYDYIEGIFRKERNVIKGHT